MDLLRPERLDTDPNSTSAAQEWTHWLKTFQNFHAVLPGDDVNRFSVLTNYISPKIYGSIIALGNQSLGPIAGSAIAGLGFAECFKRISQRTFNQNSYIVQNYLLIRHKTSRN